MAPPIFRFRWEAELFLVDPASLKLLARSASPGNHQAFLDCFRLCLLGEARRSKRRKHFDEAWWRCRELNPGPWASIHKPLHA